MSDKCQTADAAQTGPGVAKPPVSVKAAVTAPSSGAPSLKQTIQPDTKAVKG